MFSKHDTWWQDQELDEINNKPKFEKRYIGPVIKPKVRLKTTLSLVIVSPVFSNNLIFVG